MNSPQALRSLIGAILIDFSIPFERGVYRAHILDTQLHLAVVKARFTFVIIFPSCSNILHKSPGSIWPALVVHVFLVIIIFIVTEAFIQTVSYTADIHTIID